MTPLKSTDSVYCVYFENTGAQCRSGSYESTHQHVLAGPLSKYIHPIWADGMSAGVNPVFCFGKESFSAINLNYVIHQAAQLLTDHADSKEAGGAGWNAWKVRWKKLGCYDKVARYVDTLTIDGSEKVYFTKRRSDNQGTAVVISEHMKTHPGFQDRKLVITLRPFANTAPPSTEDIEMISHLRNRMSKIPESGSKDKASRHGIKRQVTTSSSDDEGQATGNVASGTLRAAAALNTEEKEITFDREKDTAFVGGYIESSSQAKALIKHLSPRIKCFWAAESGTLNNRMAVSKFQSDMGIQKLVSSPKKKKARKSNSNDGDGVLAIADAGATTAATAANNHAPKSVQSLILAQFYFVLKKQGIIEHYISNNDLKEILQFAPPLKFNEYGGQPTIIDDSKIIKLGEWDGNSPTVSKKPLRDMNYRQLKQVAMFGQVAVPIEELIQIDNTLIASLMNSASESRKEKRSQQTETAMQAARAALSQLILKAYRDSGERTHLLNALTATTNLKTPNIMCECGCDHNMNQGLQPFTHYCAGSE